MATKLLDKKDWTTDGRKWIFYDYIKNLDGTRRKYKSKKFFTKTEALQAEREFLLSNTNKADKNHNMTFKELYTLFYQYKEDKVKLTTLKTYSDREKFFKDLDNVKLKDFNIEHFEKWKKQINSYGYTTNHKNHLFKFFKELLNFATKWYNFNFTATYNKMTNFTDSNERKKMNFWTYEEFKKFIAVEDDLMYRTFFKVLYYCGLRKGEIRALDWNDIDFNNNTLTIRKGLSDNVNGKKYIISSPKALKSNRTLPLSKKFIDDLKELKKSVMQYTNFREDWFVFGNELPLVDDAIRRRKNNNCKLSNVKQIRLHDFRHSCASLLISTGADIKIVAEFLGHTKIDETLNTYVHMFKNKLNNIVNIIDSLDEMPQDKIIENIIDKDNDDYELEM